MKSLLTFFLLAYLISWGIWLPLYGHVLGLNSLPQLPFHHALGGLGPCIASFITTWLYAPQQLPNLVQRCLSLKSFVYIIVALISPFGLAMLASILVFGLTNLPLHLSAITENQEFPQFNLVQLFAYNLFFFGFGEEIGWRGFALPRLQTKYNALAASLLLTVFWAAWHFPTFFYRPGYSSMSISGGMGWFFSLLTGSVILTWLYNSSRGNLMACAIFHSTIDIVFTANFSDQSINNYMGFLITLWGIVLVMVFKPAHLSFYPRQTDTSS